MVRRRTIIVALAVVFSAAASGGARTASGEEGARQFLQALSDDAIAILNKDNLSAEQREQELGGLFDRGFHLPTVSRFVLGHHWRTATEEQRETYQRVFRDFIVKSYSKRFTGFTGEKLTITESRPEGEHDFIVFSRLMQPDGESTRVSWRIRRYDDDFKIIDVIVGGISMLITQRDEFASVIRNSGGQLDGLITLLQDKVQELE